jgi:hypothetical protein
VSLLGGKLLCALLLDEYIGREFQWGKVCDFVRLKTLKKIPRFLI